MKLKVNSLRVNFTEMRGEVRIKVFPFKFVTCEMLFKVKVKREFF